MTADQGDDARSTTTLRNRWHYRYVRPESGELCSNIVEHADPAVLRDAMERLGFTNIEIEPVD